MSRRLLGVIAALGLVISAVSGAGVFAIFTDSATAAGDVSSGEIAPAADLQLSSADVTAGAFTCVAAPGSPDVFTDDLGTVVSIQDLQPGADFVPGANLCLHNAGSAPVSVLFSVLDLVDLDLGCTGDEAVTDSTCDATADPGELSAHLYVRAVSVACADSTPIGGGTIDLPSLTTTSQVLQTSEVYADNVLPVGATVCVSIDILYPDTTSPEDVQAAQSDQVTWRLSFDGSTS